MACVNKKQLLKLQKTYKTDERIGKEFGVSRQAIHQLRAKYGIKPIRNHNKERDDKISGLYKKGATEIEIANKMGLSISQVYRVIKVAIHGKCPSNEYQRNSELMQERHRKIPN